MKENSDNNQGKKFIFNKVFSGSYLFYNLGNELINFMKLESTDKNYNNKRFIYINPYGKQSAPKNTEYVLHIMYVKYEGETYYELVAISKIDKTKNISLYNKKSSNDTRKNINEKNITFKSHALEKIFNDKKARLCSFVAKDFWIPKKNKSILFKVVDKNLSKEILPYEKTMDKTEIYKINIASNPQHSMCYSKIEDENNILNKLIDNLDKYFDLKNDFTIELENIEDEQCLAVICDRTKLEDSTSNQIAYFLNRDEDMLKRFIGLINSKIDKTDKNRIVFNSNTTVEILREKENIDLLIKIIKKKPSNSEEEGNSENFVDHIIVIENKIDSYINGIKETQKKQQKESQLSDYFEYIMEGKKKNDKESKNSKDDNEFKNVIKENKHFFILEPKYSSITKEKLKEFKNGDEYNIIYYEELIDILGDEYNPYYSNDKQDKKTIDQRQFLFQQFKEALEYISSSKAEQMKKLAYTRLKQRISELEKNNK